LTIESIIADYKATRQKVHKATPTHGRSCVHCTYFAKDKDVGARLGAQDRIRNLAVIAHVDHGKTTLADALLHKAGLLHKDRVGDQDTGRSLDTLKDEKERGITIKSAAITLDLSVRESVLNNGPYASMLKEELKASDPLGAGSSKQGDAPPNTITEVYVGNLPRGFSQGQLLDLLTSRGIPLDESDIRFSNRRSYVILSVDKELVSTVLALDGSRIEQDQDALVVQLVGDSPMSRLKDRCEAQGISMPDMSVQDKDQPSGVAFVGTARWPRLGGVVIQSPGLYASKKEARQAVAKACLEFLQRQQHNHNIAKEVEKDATKEVIKEVEEVTETISPSSGEERGDKSVVTEESDDRPVPLVINLIDSPGHIEFNAEVTAALRVSDGALLVVDVIEGKVVQTEGVLIQALREGVKPVLMVNKVDRLFIDKQYTAEEVHDRMQRVVDDINDFIATHQLKNFPDQRVSFLDGSVCFGSGYFGWSCSIDTFLEKDCSPDKSKAMRKFLAMRDNFIKYIIRPILRMHRVCGVLPMKKQQNGVDKITRVNQLISEKIPGWSGRRLLGSDDDASTIEPRKLLKKAMMAWLPAADALVDMIAAHVPSPACAQRLRAPLLYSGASTDSSFQGIYSCDPAGPAVVYISKMAPSGERRKRLLAFGRVFSGTIHVGDSLRALRTDGKERIAKIAQIKICGFGGRMHSIQSAEAGQLVALEGIDESLSKAGTLTSALDGLPIRHMNFAVAAVVQHSVRPKDLRDLTKMVSELQQVVSADSTALFYKDRETQEYILAGAGGLHIEVLVSSFYQNSGIEIELSEPIIAYRETVQSVSDKPALAKSGNKHNRVWIKASPLADEVVEAMTSGELANLDSKNLGKALVKNFGWSSSDTARIWAVGPEPLSNDEMSDVDQPTCMLVDATFGLQIPEDARSNIVAAFKQVARQGVLVNAPMRGVRFDLVDAKFHADSVHRRPNSVVPASSRAMRGAVLLADASLVEPMFRVDITGGLGALNGAYSILGKRSGLIVDTSSTSTTDAIQARVPVRQSFGLSGELRLASHGHAHCDCSFDGMRLVSTEDRDEIVAEARARKNLGDKVPTAEDFIDKL
jgi:elongation factor 2